MKKAVIFGVGFVAGAAISLIFSKKYYEKVTKEQIDEVKKYYKSKAFDEIVVDKSIEESENDDIFATNEYTSYSSIAKTYQTDDIPVIKNEEIYKMSVKEHPMDETYNDPYILDANDFANANQYYDSTTLTYYTDDGMLVDEMYNEVVDDISVVGEENLASFADSDETVIYIRNERLSMDYEVVKEEGSWEG